MEGCGGVFGVAEREEQFLFGGCVKDRLLDGLCSVRIIGPAPIVIVMFIVELTLVVKCYGKYEQDCADYDCPHGA